MAIGSRRFLPLWLPKKHQKPCQNVNMKAGFSWNMAAGDAERENPE